MSTHPDERSATSAAPEFRKRSIISLLAQAWKTLGDVLHRMTSPLVLAVLYFVVVTPIALVCRMCGHDALGLRKQTRDSWWEDAAEVTRESFKRQF